VTNPSVHVGVSQPISRWLSVSFAVFVVVASLGLVAVFQHMGLRQEEDAFSALTRSNADFLRRTTLPRSTEMADRLGAVMDAQVLFFVAADSAARPATHDETVRRTSTGHLVIGYRLDDKHDVFFSRPTAGVLALVNQPRTWLALGVLWLSSLGLGAWLARGLTKPLQQMTRAAPSLGGSHSLPPLPLERGDELGVLARSMQTTHDTLRMEIEKRRSAERLAMLGRMAASLAHEVRNPVSAIRLHAQLLDGAPASEAEASRKLIESEAERIESLVSQWMRFARPEAPVKKPVAVHDLLTRALAVVKPQAMHADVRIEHLIAANPTVQVDADRMHQVLVNVLTNAIQSHSSPGRVTVRSAMLNGRCVIEVEDEGRGFSPAALQHAAEPFFTEKEGGMGLGLAVSDELMRAHDGELRLENTATGARVSLILPADES